MIKISRSLELSRTEASFSTDYAMFQLFRSHKAETTRGIRYFGLEGRDSPRGKVVSVHVNSSPEISRRLGTTL